VPPSLLAFALTCAIIEITPGPNMAYLAALSLSRGWRIGLAAVAGVALGLSVYGIAAALGVAAAIESSLVRYQALRWGGVIYLLWLGWAAWSSADDIAPEDEPGHDHARASAFRRGLITNLLNPKAAVFYVAVLPEFLDPAAGRIAGQTLTLSAIYVAIATLIHAGIVVSASRLRLAIAKPAAMPQS
jgi:threonine/homoserine/homoserine lactone efflux protein